MRKSNIISIIAVIVLISLFLISNYFFTGQVILESKLKLGYCPTMYEEAIILFNENDYELVEFNSASEVLRALKNNQIDKALIGRKAGLEEINFNVEETILKSGYTLVSNKKGFIDYSQLSLIEIYTYLGIDFNFPVIRISKEKITEEIQKGKIVLIYWEDWNDDFELIVVMSGNKKVKDFRGVFLYENGNL